MNTEKVVVIKVPDDQYSTRSLIADYPALNAIESLFKNCGFPYYDKRFPEPAFRLSNSLDRAWKRIEQLEEYIRSIAKESTQTPTPGPSET